MCLTRTLPYKTLADYYAEQMRATIGDRGPAERFMVAGLLSRV
ncbi:hypothetical protein [Nonomuraea sp. NEAU-A123]|nr:hypothetical protein [Nonomuraea sp. NEAU-A123]